MKIDLMTKEAIAYIVARVIDNAHDAKKEREESSKEDRDFYDAKLLAYYEILDTIKNELEIREEDLKKYGLDIDLENEIS